MTTDDSKSLALFEQQTIRRVWHNDEWYYSIVDVVAVLAESHVFMDAPGAVVRCAGCDSVLLRVVNAPGRTWLDLRGLSYLQLATPAAT